MNKRTIWKFPLALRDLPSLEMPLGAEVLCVQMQGNALCLWALVDQDAPLRTRYFAIYGTGNPCDAKPADRYIGTVQQAGGALVWHVFEVAP